jgi:hypothetical protein
MGWLDPRQWLLAVAFMGAVTLGYKFGEHRLEQRGYDRAMQEVAVKAAKRTEENRDNARQAEIRYVDRETVRTQYLTITKEELRNEAKNLDSCRLDAGDIGLLNKAANTAREN